MPVPQFILKEEILHPLSVALIIPYPTRDNKFFIRCPCKKHRKYIIRGGNSVQLDFGNSKAVLRSVFHAANKTNVKLPAPAHQIPELADVSRWKEAIGYQVTFKDIDNPHGILLVGLLPWIVFIYFGWTRKIFRSAQGL